MPAESFSYLGPVPSHSQHAHSSFWGLRLVKLLQDGEKDPLLSLPPPFFRPSLGCG